MRSERMSAGFQALTEKEKQTLRLIVRGHDAKSSARHLGLSVHTINERLRDARRKLGVSSSREAARLLLDTESKTPKNIVDKQIGEARAPEFMEQVAAPGFGQGRIARPTGAFAGVAIMSIFLGVLALSLLSQETAPSTATSAQPPSEANAQVAAAESDVVQSALDWLALGDQSRWKDAWLAAGASFKTLNTAERWTAAAQKVRLPMGALVSRTRLSQERVPAPPAGVEVVKFRSSFENRANVIEKVTLAREGARWKVVGIYVE